MKRQTFLRFCALTALLCMQAYTLVAADVYSLSVAKQPRMTIKTGASGHKNTFVINNYGTIVQKNFHYKATMNGKVVDERTVTFSTPLHPNRDATLTLNIPAQSRAGDYELTLEITQINGKPNESPGRIAKLPITAVNKLPTCRVVFEDYTANWCSWCPSGIAIMRQMTKKHPNDFIGIVAHHQDVMVATGYDVPATPHSGVPIVWASRTNKVEGFMSEPYYQMAKQRGAMMDIDVQAQWNANGKSINVQSTTTFRTNMPNANYALAYVVVEDGMHNASWSQANSFDGLTYLLNENEEMAVFVKGGRVVYGLKYNHVARAFLGIDSGMEGSLPKNVVADRGIKHQAMFEGVGRNWTPQNKKNLRVVVMVLDNSTNSIVNGAHCPIKPYNTTGVATTKNTDQRVEVARFNLKGQRLSAPEKGINIVKYSDGTVEKVNER